MFDYTKVRARFNRACRTYDRFAAVQQEVGERLDERFEWLKIEPRRILDLGAGTGQMTRAMQKRYPAAQVVALDLAEQMLAVIPKTGRLFKRRRVVCADMHALPFKPGSFDVVVSNFSLQWSHDLAVVMAEVARVLTSGGAFVFSTLGPDTLQECRTAWMSVDGSVHTHGFLDMHDVGDALLSSCFVDPVMDQEQLTLYYRSPTELIEELRGVGVGNTHTDRLQGLTGRKTWQRFMDGLESQRTERGIPLTYEVVYGLAWGAGLSPVQS